MELELEKGDEWDEKEKKEERDKKEEKEDAWISLLAEDKGRRGGLQ